MGGFNALWLDAASVAGTFLAILSVPALKQQAQGLTFRSVLAGIAEGFRWLWASPVIKVLSFQAMAGNFGFGMVSAVLKYYLRSTLGGFLSQSMDPAIIFLIAAATKGIEVLIARFSAMRAL